MRAYGYLFQGQISKAITTMKSNLIKFPKSVHMYIDFAGKCEEIHRYDIALQFYLRYAIYCMGISDIPEEKRNHFPYFLTEPQLESVGRLHPPTSNGEVVLEDLVIDQYFLSIERIADICLWFQDNEVFHNDMNLINKSQSAQEKSSQMCAIFNEFAVTILDACFSYLDRLRNQTSRRGDHDALQAPMIIGFLYGISRMRRNHQDDVSAGLRVINPLITALSKNRAIVIGEIKEGASDEYVENFSLLKQQVHLVEELLNHGMITRSARLAVDLIKEYNYLMAIFYEDELTTNVDNILPLITSLAVSLKKASEQGDSVLRGSCLAAASSAFAMAIQLDPTMADIQLTVRYVEFLLHQQSILHGNPNFSINYLESEDNAAADGVFCPSENLENGLTCALQRFDNYFDQKVFCCVASLSSRTENFVDTTFSQNVNDEEGEVEADDDGRLNKDANENAEMERIFGKLDVIDAEVIPVKFSRTSINYSVLRKQKHAAQFDMTAISGTKSDAEKVAALNARQSTDFENKFSLEDIDRDIIGLISWGSVLRINDSSQDALCRILLPLLMCWVRNADRYYNRKNQQIFNTKICSISPVEPSSTSNSYDSSTDEISAQLPQRSVDFDPSIVTNLMLEVNKNRNKLLRDPRFEYLPLLEKSSVESIVYTDAVVFECPDIIAWLNAGASNADYFIYIYSISLYSFISHLLGLDTFCLYARDLLNALNSLGYKSLSNQLKAVFNPYFDKSKSQTLSSRGTAKFATSNLITGIPSTSSSLQSTHGRTLPPSTNEHFAKKAEHGIDEYIFEKETQSKAKSARAAKKLLYKPSLALSNGITAISSIASADIFPDAHLTTSELNQFVRAAEVISAETKKAALDLLKSPRQLAMANLLVKSIISSAEHPLEPKYVEQTFAVNRFPLWFPDNIGSLLLAGNERAQSRKFAEALDKYLDAYELDKSQPLTCLYISSLLIFLAYFRLIKQRIDVLNKGLVFLEQYKITRRLHANKIREYIQNTSDVVPSLIEEDDVVQEIYYNLGRAMSECEMQHLAVDNYTSALDVQDDYDILHDTNMNAGGRVLPLTRQAAHNLVLILKKSQANSHAYQVMRKYLTL